MKSKPIRIDWDELEVAFNNQNEDVVYCLDLVTGHVVIEGEGEEDEFEDEEKRQGRPDATAATRRDDSTRAYIEPLDAESKLEWMKGFLSEAEGVETEAIEKLGRAMEAEEPAAEIGAVLREHADARDGWYLYRSERLHERISRWLEAHGITALDPPPWGP